MTGTASSAARVDPWILGPWRDALLFIATPLVILPLALLVQRGVRLEDMALFVASFGALGHHLPGMLRAYGDRELFRRFRTRFVVAPIFIVGMCVLAALRGWVGLQLVVYGWGIWHGLAQTYGFLRIYDAKVRSAAPLTCRLDLALCVAWFLGVVALSPTRLREVVNLLYQSGLPLAPEAWIGALRTGAAGGIVLVTAAFLVHAGLRWRQGTPPSALKLALMLTSFGFWWFANVHVTNLLLGVLLFELFHDVQYLSIVWAFSRSRAAKGADLGGWNRLLFRGGFGWTGLYVGLVFAYGTLNYGAQWIEAGTLHSVALGALAASALLHFYFDGFIWKVRERATAQSLGLAGGREGVLGVAGWKHAAKWLLLLVPLGGLAAAQARGVVPEHARAQALARDFGQAKDHLDVGAAALEAGETSRAASSFRAALERDPTLTQARVGLGDALFFTGDLAAAEQCYREALRLAEAAAAHTGLGNVLGARGDLEAAMAAYRRAAELDPEHAPARANLGLALARLGRSQEALATLQAAVALAPYDAELLRQLGALELAAGRAAAALERYEAALALVPEDPEALYGAANAHALLGDREQAVALYRRALAARPSFPEARRNLGTVLHQRGELEAAEASLRAAVSLAPGDGDSHLHLAAVLRARGLADEAERHEAIGRRLASTP